MGISAHLSTAVQAIRNLLFVTPRLFDQPGDAPVQGQPPDDPRVAAHGKNRDRGSVLGKRAGSVSALGERQDRAGVGALGDGAGGMRHRVGDPVANGLRVGLQRAVLGPSRAPLGI